MSANLFDAGDMQRLEREQTLTEQLPRVQPVEVMSPVENDMTDDGSTMLEELLMALEAALKGKLQ